MNPPGTAEDLWRQFHWAFFVNTQGLIIALKRFDQAFLAGELCSASEDLRLASELLRSSAASMELAGAYTREEYRSEVRPSMAPPSVSLDNFSGLMSWDHTAMIRLWKRMQPTFEQARETLPVEHAEFVAAYRQLADSHHAVCARFGGDRCGSIRHKEDVAVEVLDRFAKSRNAMIGCPIHTGETKSGNTPSRAPRPRDTAHE